MKQIKETSAKLFECAARLQVAAHHPDAPQTTVDSYISLVNRAHALQIVETEVRGKAFHDRQFDAKHGGQEWWDLIHTQYSIEAIGVQYKVISHAREWSEAHTWIFDSQWLAYAKIEQLVFWLDQIRLRGIGDRKADVSRLSKKLT